MLLMTKIGVPRKGHSLRQPMLLAKWAAAFQSSLLLPMLSPPLFRPFQEDNVPIAAEQ
jgi:hypothetical protein